MNTFYVLSQVFVIIQYIFLAMTYHVKNKKDILLCNTIGCISSSISFLFLGAYSGCLMSLLAVLRNFLFNKSNKKNSFIIIIILLTVLTIISYDTLFSLMPSLATFMYTISVFQNNRKLYRILGIPIEISWLIYQFYVFSIFGIILEIILFIAVIIGILREKK